jgi:ATP-dependent RNA helicase RhlE
MTFDQFSIDKRCLDTLKAQGILKPMPIQAQSIPAALDGRDIVAIAQTGTGKTLAFALPALTRLAAIKGPVRNGMLVLTPTRELALQVHSVIEPMARKMSLRSVCIYGGAGMAEQTDALRRGCAILVATPGRLLDHMGRGSIRFDQLSILVLDEADRMLDMGFLQDIRRILGKLPTNRQTMMFSATFPREIAQLASAMQNSPLRIEVEATSKAADTVRQGVYTVEQTEKTGLLSKILREPHVQSALVFLRTKHRTDRLARTLGRDGFKVGSIHGDRSQRQRQQALDGFRRGHYNVLVATDIAARGLDIQGLSHVINYDIPMTSDEYIHRIGRTGRANATGDAITFVSPDDCKVLASIEAALGRNIPREEWEGAVPVQTLYNPEGAPQRRGNNPRSNPRRSGGRGFGRRA